MFFNSVSTYHGNNDDDDDEEEGWDQGDENRGSRRRHVSISRYVFFLNFSRLLLY